MKYSSDSDYGLEDLLKNTYEVVGCYLWKGYVHMGRYGHTRYHGKMKVVHRLAYELAHGFLSPRSIVLHICPHRTCCNPHHVVTDSVSMVELVRKPNLSIATWSKSRQRAFKKFIPGVHQCLRDVFQGLVPNDENP